MLIKDKFKPLVPPGEKGGKGNPLSMEELKKMISDSNGGAEVEIKGFTELSQIDAAVMDLQDKDKLMANSPDASLPPLLVNSLRTSLRDISREPKKIFEDRGRSLFLALDEDGNLWLLEGNSWIQIKEPSYPDLPKKEIK